MCAATRCLRALDAEKGEHRKTMERAHPLLEHDDSTPAAAADDDDDDGCCR